MLQSIGPAGALRSLAAPGTSENPAPKLESGRLKGLSAAKQGELRKAAKEFEGILIQQLLGQMRQARLTEDPLDKGPAADILHGMQDEAMGRELAAGRGLGLGDQLFRELAGLPKSHIAPPRVTA